jgi:hypothetical protein
MIVRCMLKEKTEKEANLTNGNKDWQQNNSSEL